MDFFKFTYISDGIIRASIGTIDLRNSFIIGAVCFAVVYILEAIGLFIIASRAGYKNKWMAFFPILNTFYIGVCGQKNKFLNIDTRIISLVAAITEAILCVVCILYYVAFVKINAVGGVVLNVEFMPIDDISEIGVYLVSPKLSNSTIPDNLSWAIWYLNYYYIFVQIFFIVYLFTYVITLSCFFQTYAARRYFLFALTCILPFSGMLIFAVRNNKGIKYSEYIKMVQERAYRQYRSQQNFNQNPYNQNPYSSDYNRPPYQNTEPHQQQSQPHAAEPEDPFAEFSSKGKGGGPFDEFN